MSERYSYSWFISQFRTAREQAENFILPLDSYSFFQRPSENTWCVAECYSHLINFGEIYLDTIREALDGDIRTLSDGETEGEFRPRLLWRTVVAFFEPPYRIKVGTFAPFEPDGVSDVTKEEIIENFTDLQDRFIAQLENAEHQRLDLTSIKVRNPIFSFLKMTPAECYAVADAHQRRHLWQAEQVLTMLE